MQRERERDELFIEHDTRSAAVYPSVSLEFIDNVLQMPNAKIFLAKISLPCDPFVSFEPLFLILDCHFSFGESNNKLIFAGSC